MWLLVMFDLPVCSSKERKQATRFRQHLIDLGFEMAQFSVYLKYCISAEKAESFCHKIKAKIPDGGGKIDILTITDKQFANTIRYQGNNAIKMPDKPQQLQIF